MSTACIGKSCCTFFLLSHISVSYFVCFLSHQLCQIIIPFFILLYISISFVSFVLLCFSCPPLHLTLLLPTIQHYPSNNKYIMVSQPQSLNSHHQHHQGGLPSPKETHTALETCLHDTAHIDYDRVAIVSIYTNRTYNTQRHLYTNTQTRQPFM